VSLAHCVLRYTATPGLGFRVQGLGFKPFLSSFLGKFMPFSIENLFEVVCVRVCAWCVCLCVLLARLYCTAPTAKCTWESWLTQRPH
jgi:hypothetical protein